MMRRLLLPLLLGLLSACGAPDPLAGLPCGMLMLAELPVTMVGRVPLVQVTVAGQTATMILDTGAQKTVLTQSAVRRLHLQSDARLLVTVSGVGGSSRSFPAILTGLSVGGQKLADQHAMVLPFDLPKIEGVTVDGLLGVDVLGRFEVDLDLPHQRVGLYGGRLCPDDALAIPGPLVAMEVPRTNRGRLLVHASLDGETVTALLDTGAEGTVVMLPAMLRAGVPRTVLSQDRQVSLRGAGPAPAPAWVHQFSSLSVAGENFAGPYLRVTEPSVDVAAWWQFQEPTDDDMIFGIDYLSRHRFWLAYPRLMVFLQRQGEP